MSFWGEFNCPKCVLVQTDCKSLVDVDLIFYGHIPLILPHTRSAKRIGPHDFLILSIVFGSLLGDGYGYGEKHGCGTRIRFYQEGSHKDYLLWLHSLISSLGYTDSTPPSLSARIGNYGKMRYIIRFNTYTYSSFNWIYDCWYINNNKVITDISILDLYLSPLAVAIWLMDDGAKVSSGLKFCTNSFLLSDVEKLSQVLNKKFSLFTNVHSAGVPNQYVIYVPKKSIEQLKNLVGQHLHPSMLYKLKGAQDS
jgi:ubiquinol-cytochrome c reductase cytochrome b subunit